MIEIFLATIILMLGLIIHSINSLIEVLRPISEYYFKKQRNQL